jgi:hypothetical protein
MGTIIIFACVVGAALVGYLFGQNMGYERGHVAGQMEQVQEQIKQVRKLRSEVE